MTALEINQDPFEIVQTSVIHSHSLANLEVRPRLIRQSRAKRLADRLELSLLDGNRIAAVPQDLLYARGHQKRATIQKIKSAEQITGEERLLHFFHPVRPATDTLVQRQEALIALLHELSRNHGFAP